MGGACESRSRIVAPVLQNFVIRTKITVEDNPEGIYRAYGLIEQVITPVRQIVSVKYPEPGRVKVRE